MVLRPELYQRNAHALSRQVVPLPRPSGVEVAHQVPAVGAGPIQDVEGVCCHRADVIDVPVEARVLKAFNHACVEAAGGLLGPFLGKLDVPVQLACVGIVNIERPEDLELGARVTREDLRTYGGDVVADGLPEEVGVDVAVHRRVVLRREEEVSRAAVGGLEGSRGRGVVERHSGYVREEPPEDLAEL